MIPTRTRHDIYPGLISGAKGVAIWSLFPRGEVRRTFRIHYNAYATVAKEITGPKNPGQVFLFGEDHKDLTVSHISGVPKGKLFALRIPLGAYGST